MTGSMEQLYQQVILDHSRERHGAGGGGPDAPPASAESFQVNPTCGDEVRLRVHLREGATAPIIDRVTWDGTGCSISQASVSVLTDLVAGADVAKVDRVTETFRALMNNRGQPLEDDREEILGDAAAFVGVARYPARIKCALLGWMALRDALAQAVTAPPQAGER